MLDWLVLLVCGSIIVIGLLAVCLDSLMPAVISAGLASVFAGEHAACARGQDELRQFDRKPADLGKFPYLPRPVAQRRNRLPPPAVHCH
jgi:hypothetical protein